MDFRMSSHTHSSHTENLHPNSALYRVPFSSNHPSSVPSQDHSHLYPSSNGYRQSMDHSQLADSRTFFSYIPNEVKHRKRTTRAQLKVLEDVFDKDTKPNAGLRKALASKLDMTPRGVQVWFQNRRAKEKHQVKKALASATTNPTAQHLAQHGISQRDASPTRESSTSSTDTEVPSPAADDNSQPALSIVSSPASDIQSHTPDSAPSPWHSSPITTSHPVRQTIPEEGHDDQLLSIRRGSEPAIISRSTSLAPPVQSPLDAAGRRMSMDMHLYRLTCHPYARHVIERNEALNSHLPSHIPPPSRRSTTQVATPFSPNRPNLSHRASMPHVFASTSSRLRRPIEHQQYVPLRATSSPIPGPLPSPTFSFGAGSSSPATNSPGTGTDKDDVRAQFGAFSFPEVDDRDEDDTNSTSYDGISRFGSIASIPGSESSNTSVIYSDVSSSVAETGFDPMARRGSCNVLEMGMSGMSMRSRSSQGSIYEHVSSPLSYSQDPLSPLEHERLPPSGYTTAQRRSPEVADASLQGEMNYGYQNVREVGTTVQKVPPNINRSHSISDHIPQIFVQDSAANRMGLYPSESIDPNRYDGMHYSGGNYVRRMSVHGQEQEQGQVYTSGNEVVYPLGPYLPQNIGAQAQHTQGGHDMAMHGVDFGPGGSYDDVSAGIGTIVGGPALGVDGFPGYA